ncbi:MAG TPA: sugar phosphate isomerase/epimerase [Agriterribacter sp.]|nr:sugar phosphate isomerase/epimerase [Agriterribacter sp.]
MHSICSLLSSKKAVLALWLFVLSLPVFSQEIGVQLYTFRKQIPGNVPSMLEKISKMGIKELEGGGSYDLPVDEFKSLLKKNGLKMVSVGGDFKELATNPQAAVDLAKTYGAKYVVCFWIPHGNEFTIEDAKSAVNVFNTAGKLLKENGISFCYHAHGYEFVPYEGETMFDYMAKNLNPAYANFEMDVFWVKHPGQDPVALLKKYPNRFPLMHLKDRATGTIGNQKGEADVETNVVLGSGDVGIAAIMKVAKKLGVKHYFIEDESSRSLEQVPLSLAYIKSLK